jgi:hypothetical protein
VKLGRPSGSCRWFTTSFAAGRLVQLYEAWGKPERAAEWRKRLDLEAELPADPFAK